MDVQLKELIDRINSDVIRKAEENASRIITDAANQAAEILAKAQDDARTLTKDAQAEAQRVELNGREALKQAGRDLIITLKAEIENLFNNVLTAEIARVLDGALLSEAVISAIGSLADSESDGLDILLPEGKLKALHDGIAAKLASMMSAGVEIRPFKDLDAGFRIVKKDGSAFFDFSDKEIALLLSRYLNPQLRTLLSG